MCIPSAFIRYIHYNRHPINRFIHYFVDRLCLLNLENVDRIRWPLRVEDISVVVIVVVVVVFADFITVVLDYSYKMWGSAFVSSIFVPFVGFPLAWNAHFACASKSIQSTLELVVWILRLSKIDRHSELVRTTNKENYRQTIPEVFYEVSRRFPRKIVKCLVSVVIAKYINSRRKPSFYGDFTPPNNWRVFCVWHLTHTHDHNSSFHRTSKEKLSINYINGCGLNKEKMIVSFFVIFHRLYGCVLNITIVNKTRE